MKGRNYNTINTIDSRLYRKASQGDQEAIRTVRNYTNRLKVEANTRIRNLARAGYDSGTVYNNALFFTQSEYGLNRFKTPKELNYDIYDMKLQNKIIEKFLSKRESSVEGRKESDYYRLERLKELEIIPENISDRKSKGFLKFLGNEEISGAIDEYGRSDIIVEMTYDIYKRQGKNGLNVLKRALAEHFAEPNKLTFDQAMNRAGIKIEDYMSKRPSS